MKHYLLDANVVLRFITQDNAAHLQRATRLIEDAAAGNCELHLTHPTILEIAFTLLSFYGYSRSKLAAELQNLIERKGIVVRDKPIMDNALARYSSKKVDFADALLAAESAALGIPPASFDRDLDKFPDIKRYEP